MKLSEMEAVWSSLDERVVSRRILAAILKSRIANCDTGVIMQVPCSAGALPAPESVKLTYVHYEARNRHRWTIQWISRQTRRTYCRCRARKMRNVCISMRIDPWMYFPSWNAKLDFTHTSIYIKIIYKITYVLYEIFIYNICT